MNIEILEVMDNNYVNVKYIHGSFIGKWMDKNVPQKRRYEVEIDYNKILHYEILNEKYYCIKNLSGKNIICGFILLEGRMNEEKVGEMFQWIDFIGNGILHIDKNDNGQINEYVEGNIMQIGIQDNNLKNKFIGLELDEIELYPIEY